MPAPKASPGSLMVTEVTMGETALGTPNRSIFSPLNDPVRDRKPMKTLDYLAAPLAALKAGDARKAIRMLEEILVVHPEVVETGYHLARASEKVGDLARARELYAEVVADGGHPFFSHAQNRLNELGAPPSASQAAVAEPVQAEPAAELAAEPAAAEPVQAEPAAGAPADGADPVAEAVQAEPAAATADGAEPVQAETAQDAAAAEAPAEGAEGGKKKKKK